jgi:hypothetical protein
VVGVRAARRSLNNRIDLPGVHPAGCNCSLRYAFLLHDTWPLPAGSARPGAVFSRGVPVRTVRLGPPGPESVFSVWLCGESPDTDRDLDLAGAIAFHGLTLAGRRPGATSVTASGVGQRPGVAG